MFVGYLRHIITKKAKNITRELENDVFVINIVWKLLTTKQESQESSKKGSVSIGSCITKLHSFLVLKRN